MKICLVVLLGLLVCVSSKSVRQFDFGGGGFGGGGFGGGGFGGFGGGSMSKCFNTL